MLKGIMETEWRDGMTKKEFFDTNVKCGDLQQDSQCVGGFEYTYSNNCGAKDWRVIRPTLFAPWEYALQCNKCHRWTLVTMPDWEKKIVESNYTLTA